MSVIFRKPVYRIAILLVVSLVLPGCASWESDKGVETTWREAGVPEWTAGETRDVDVMGELGPPSQIIALENETVYYYLRETSKGRSYIFILWNSANVAVEYDRAVFFFDRQGLLTKYAYSKPREDVAGADD